MVKWEYESDIAYKYHTSSEWIMAMNGRGRDGWELVTVQPIEDYFRFIFKRPLPIEVIKLETWTDKGLS